MRLYRIFGALAASAAAAGAATAAGAPATDAAALRQQMALQPGRWHTTATITSAETSPTTPGKAAPPEAGEALKKQIGRTFETDDCIGASAADGSLILPGVHVGPGCRYEDVSVQAGRFAFTTRCGNQGFEAEVSAQGRYGPTTIEATLATRTVAEAAGMRTAITLTTRSTRTGACSA